MDITICGWNVVISCQRKIYQKLGTEFLEQQQNDREERTRQIKQKIAELRSGFTETEYIHSLRRERTVEMEKRNEKKVASSEMDSLREKLRKKSK